MTAIEICALIVSFIALAILYWTGYRGGLIDGRVEGIEEGKNIQRADNSEEIRNLNLLLEQARTHHKSLYRHYTRALEATKLGATDRLQLIAIAEKLQLAADTFRAVNSKNHAIQALALRDKALSVAALLEPTTQEKAA
ncbi:hypothetical protein IFR35_09785 [Pseudomonas fluorescens]|uniref:hypothetical protein n=1 Tax=Pseudomonas fluorescens TaxID=294 RepID=UPI00177D2C39|nr:hypothetical protein [Pseudomonas fluorescens]MBD8192160.1 hypothetical protein [Pseudomonas fluorescens]MBD8226784.1 hypothetical protein [Pseudomonas fluorescens]MBD8784497.1 hypothetical protein [Pseudomonas fluorescens]MBD8817177.1 hypothetical protein [Pseudomonas fluorescens]